ncbi:MAG: uncharacterized protein QOH68_2006, partial [Nocardioidaceae bacterium]|nr:uncharacterized protein [Nocardioidaceae bacterium]
HYAAYDQYWTQVTPLITDWFDRYLGNGSVVVTSGSERSERVEYLGGN